MEHRKLDALMTPVERIARVAAAGVNLAKAPQTAPSGAISLDNADGTRTIIGEVVNGEDNPSYTMATHVGDTTPPGIPTGITATSKSGVVVVEWDGTLEGGIPDDFFCVRIYLDGAELGALTEAGSVASAKLDGGTTVLVTATSEDDCCLPDGTPDHNVSQASQAISITVTSSAAEIIVDVEDEIDGIEQEIADFKGNTYTKAETDKKVQDLDDEISTELTTNYYNKTQIDTNYATKTLVSQTKEEIKLSASQTYATKGESQPNLSPFFAHDLTDVYNATTNPDGYFAGDPRKSGELGIVGTQLDDGWMHVELDNSARTDAAWLNLHQRPFANLEPSTPYTLLIELRNATRDGSCYLYSQADSGANVSQTVNPGGNDNIDIDDGTYRKALVTKPDMSAATLFCRQTIAIVAGKRASFDIRLSLYRTLAPELLLDVDAPTLTKVDGPFDRYFSYSAQADVVDAEWGLLPDPPEEAGASHGATIEYDGSYSAGNRYRGPVFYTGATSGPTAPQFMEGGKQYQAAVWARATSTAYVQCSHINSGTSMIWQPSASTALALTTEWRLYAFSLRPTTPQYSRVGFLALFPPSTAGKVELCGFSLREMDATFKPYVTDQAALSKEYSTKAELKVGLDGITTEVSETYATKTASAPNLNPFFAHDFLDIYNATTNPGGWWRGSVQRDFATQLQDGWARVIIDNTSGTALLARAFRFGASPDLKDGGKYTCLVEMRNILSKPTSATIYTQQGTDVQFWGDYRYDGWTVYWEQVEGDTHVEYKQMKRVEAVSRQTTGVVCFSMNVQVPAGQKADFEIRLSLFENESDSKGKTIPYAGPYKPFVTDQQALGTTYTAKTTFEQTTQGFDSRITQNANNIAGEVLARETLIRQYANGVLVCKVGESVGALVNASGSFDVVAVTWSGNNPTVGGELAKFGQESQIGQESETFLGIDSRSMRLTDGASSQTYFEAADLRGDDGVATLTSTYIADGITATQAYEIFILPLESIEEVTGVTLDGTATTRFYVQNLNEVVVENTTKGQTVAITYTTESVLAKAYTLGIRRGGGDVGAMSVAEGIYTMAQGAMAHAEGSWTQANGEASHAGGESTTANGPRSFAHGTDVVADYDSQIVVGKYNARGLNSLFEVGTGDPTMRESGFWVGEDGATRIGTYGTAIAGVFFGSKVVDPAGAAYATLFTSTEAVTEFGQAPNAARDIVVLTNGDPNAYQGQMTAALTGGNIRAYFSPTKSGNIRVNYLVIIGA